MLDSSGINNHAEVVEAFRINVSDAGAVPAASTTDTFFEVLVVTSIAKTATECIFDGGEIGSTCVVKVRRDRKQRIDANDNAPFAMAVAA